MPERRDGPDRIEQDAAQDFLRSRSWGVLCIEAGGALIACPSTVVDAREDGSVRLSICAQDMLSGFDGVAACFVADSFETYAAIRGVIAQGTATSELDGTVRVTLTRLSGFAFAGRVPGAPT